MVINGLLHHIIFRSGHSIKADSAVWNYILMNWKMQADVGKLLGGWPNARAFLQSKGVADYADVADKIFNKVMPSPNSHFNVWRVKCYIEATK